MAKKRYDRVAVVKHSNPAANYTRINCEELETALRVLKENEFRLLMYYFSKNSRWKFKDTEICETLGIKDRTLNDLRKGLIDKGFLLIYLGNDINNYFVGEEAVRSWKMYQENKN